MTVKDIKTFERRFFEEQNKGKVTAMAIMDESFATNIVYHNGTGEDVRGLKEYKQYTNEAYNAFPDLHFTIDDLVVEGDKAVVRFTMTGTHKGVIMGISPTDKKVTIWGIGIDRIVGGKVVESWERVDTLSLMRQLGVIPTSEKGK